MAMIHAEQRNFDISEDNFIVVNSLSKAIDSLSKNETQLFYWEKFTTRPYVKSGEVNLVGDAVGAEGVAIGEAGNEVGRQPGAFVPALDECGDRLVERRIERG